MKEIENIDQAIAILIQGCKIANKAGAYELEDAAVIASAIEYLKQQAQPAPSEEPVVETEA